MLRVGGAPNLVRLATMMAAVVAVIVVVVAMVVAIVVTVVVAMEVKEMAQGGLPRGSTVIMVAATGVSELDERTGTLLPLLLPLTLSLTVLQAPGDKAKKTSGEIMPPDRSSERFQERLQKSILMYREQWGRVITRERFPNRSEDRF